MKPMSILELNPLAIRSVASCGSFFHPYVLAKSEPVPNGMSPSVATHLEPLSSAQTGFPREECHLLQLL